MSKSQKGGTIIAFAIIFFAFLIFLLKTNDHRSSPIPDKNSLKIIAGGDVMLGRSVNTSQIKHQNWSWAWEQIQDQTKQSDLFLVNLETPIIKNCPSSDEGMVFCAPVESIAGFQTAAVGLVNLANNHMLDQGQKGLQETKDLLTTAQIDYIGETGDGYGSLLIREIKGARLGFLGYDDISQSLDHQKIIAQITAARQQEQVDYLTISIHWGNEYQAVPSKRQTDLAHLMVESGADLIIGHHSHWLQKSEKYLDSHIYYSLGNLIFDQMWSEETRIGMLLEIDLQVESGSDEQGNKKVIPLQIKELPTKIYDSGQPRLINND